ncbi:bifunctional 5,10-methylenetetrahydrofolate dehydrogenase/5,10-methenyltetrahydrofolate cyclohydrolase [Pseudobdellovibrio exovorus]|uniref:Bifunctional protein FolD n=1 Tax=Pseudobdellovibrio exovorus JSS TaxID=1184267 RepID=M4V654_9BACT|nr:bifunctional 5,10-methylenetetrahydrofolate dehydrogenase/5,10-methenyltetrahydrofolate cyclohydrolase [Pseudobdellovibrio exovorus]AGH94852.1 methylenetetrahydrofolate dehydrogenase (NADP+) / methenyltetrahydrofolate cyclohydrolase [Pseudobdellovibrio exovorus JSS]
MLLLKGKPVAEQIYHDIRQRSQALVKAPHLAVILVGNDPASEVYVGIKEKTCIDIGFKSSLYKLAANITEHELAKKIHELNTDTAVDAILLQLPLPAHLNARKLTNLIAVQKDADGLTAQSLGLLVSAQAQVASCTPSGIMAMLRYYQLSVAGKKVLVIGRSLIVGMPLFHLLNQSNATVTLAHSKTTGLKDLVKDFDFVFVAAGQPHFLKATDFKKNAVVIDVGMHRKTEGLIGDVDPDGAEGHLSAMTPVPGGVGPMTIVMLMYNTLILSEKNRAK